MEITVELSVSVLGNRQMWANLLREGPTVPTARNMLEMGSAQYHETDVRIIPTLQMKLCLLFNCLDKEKGIESQGSHTHVNSPYTTSNFP